jgi:hypothetical protein
LFVEKTFEEVDGVWTFTGWRKLGFMVTSKNKDHTVACLGPFEEV